MSAAPVVLFTDLLGSGQLELVERVVRERPGTRVVAIGGPDHVEQVNAHGARLSEATRAALTVLDADVLALDLGLAGAEYCRLAERVTHICHAPPVFELTASEQRAESNVVAMREVLEFARACPGLERLLVQSSTFVSGSRAGLVLESELVSGQNFRAAAERTLATAELMADRASRELPIAIVRRSWFLGLGRAGGLEYGEALDRLIAIVARSPETFRLPVPLYGDELVHWVPVEHWAECAAFVLFAEHMAGARLHLTDPSPPRLRRFMELVARALGRRLGPEVPVSRLARALPGDRAARAEWEFLANVARYDVAQAKRVSGEGGFPAFESYLEALLPTYREQSPSPDPEPSTGSP